MDTFLLVMILFVLLLLQYVAFIRPGTESMGATEQEVEGPMDGDELAERIVSTRAITIHAPVSGVWYWLIQIGADRAGFFSYSFLERAMGYIFSENYEPSESPDFEIGRVIPTSLDESKSLFVFQFPVTAADPERYFVLEGWGAFIVQEIKPDKTRLIVRNHGRKPKTLWNWFEYCFGTPLHYVMERRMMMGIKQRVEAGAGERLSSTSDNLWLAGLILSAAAITLLVFSGGGLVGMGLSILFSSIWLWTFLIFKPRPEYSLALFSLAAAALLIL
ncbi:MAG: hypothetical protein JXA25_04525 [Anaerolineales bacterium]|nr:hypothetical protein [Anaerolineales bacterium]